MSDIMLSDAIALSHSSVVDSSPATLLPLSTDASLDAFSLPFQPTFDIATGMEFKIGIFSIEFSAGLSWAFSSDLKTLVPDFSLGVSLGLTTEAPGGFDTGLGISLGGMFEVPALKGVTLPNPTGQDFASGASWGLELGGSAYLLATGFPVDIDLGLGASLSIPTDANGTPTVGISISPDIEAAVEEPLVPFDIYGKLTGGTSFSLYNLGEAAIEAIIALGKDALDDLRGLSNEVIDFILNTDQNVLAQLSSIPDTVIDSLQNAGKNAITEVRGLSNEAIAAINQFGVEVIESIRNLDSSVISTIQNTIQTYGREVIQSIRGLDQGFVDTLRNTSSDSLNTIRTMERTVLDGIRGLDSGLVTSIRGLNNTVFDFLSSTTSNTVNLILKYGSRLFEYLPRSVGMSNDSVSSRGIIDEIKEMANLGKILSNAKIGANELRTIINLPSSTLNAVVGQSDLMKQVRSIQLPTLNTIRNLETPILNQVRSILDPVLNAVTGATTDALNAIRSVSDVALNPLFTLTGDVVNALDQLTTGAFNVFKTVTGDPLNQILSFTESTLNTLLNTARPLLDQAQDLGWTVLNDVIAYGKEIVNLLQGLDVDVIQEILDLTGFGQDLYDLMKNGVDAGLDALPGLLKQSATFLNELPNKILDMSGPFLDKFLDLLPELPPEAIAALQDFANTVVQNLPPELQGIESPFSTAPEELKELANFLSGFLPTDFADSFIGKLPAEFIKKFAEKLPDNFFGELTNVVNGFIGNAPGFIGDFVNNQMPETITSDQFNQTSYTPPKEVPVALADGFKALVDEIGIPHNPVTGTARADRLTGTSRNDIVMGLAENDTLSGGGGNDIVIGGQGNDEITGGSGHDELRGGQGDDTVRGGDDNDTLEGGEGNDNLNGGQGNDSITGGKGSDTLTGGGGADVFTIRAGDGVKTITDFRGVGRGANPNPDVKEVDRLAFIGTDLTVQNMLLTQQGNDLEITFDGVADTTVKLKNFSLEKLENLSNGIGNISFNGEALPTDSFDVIDANAQPAVVAKPNSVTFLNQLNNTVAGLDGSNDVINGQGGNDSLTGLTGNDTLRGGAGNDTLDGGYGFDLMDGGSGIDTVTYDFYGGGIDANLLTGVVGFPGNSPLTDTVRHVENMIGSRGNDNLIGSEGNNVLSGNHGNDTVDGGLGDDHLLGDAGNDVLIGGKQYIGIISDPNSGSAYITWVDRDTVTGGSGADTFVIGDRYHSYYQGTGVATITDFNGVEGDVIQLYGAQSANPTFKSYGGFKAHTLDLTQNYGGSVALDTAIYYGGDLIAVVLDNTSLTSNNFTVTTV